MMGDRLKIDHDDLAAFCRRHRITKLSLFGSVLREDFGPTSDIDVLVEFEAQADRNLTYFVLADIQFELERMFGRSVDLTLASALDHRLENEILSSAQVQYVAA